jgi:anhydro-N-acetylmuramic acid kinase
VKVALPSERNFNKAIGIMSGTSSDGLDLCLVEFSNIQTQDFLKGENDPSFLKDWQFNIIKSRAIPYTPELQNSIRSAHLLNSIDLKNLHFSYSSFVGKHVNQLLEGESDRPIIGFHGPTLFHDTQKKISLQLGDALELSKITTCPVVANFRLPDLLKGGRGAPLVPIGDELLFSSYSACVNLGGFANYSAERNGRRVASDISICNYAMDHLVRRIDLEYDHNGDIARSGDIDESLLDKLNNTTNGFKDGVALTREWAEVHILPLLIEVDITTGLRTMIEHIAQQMPGHLSDAKTILVTGGGAHNGFLIQCIQAHLKGQVIVPEKEIIEMKEALIFALLALLKQNNLNNVRSSATGACQDHSTGELFSPNN